MTVCMWHNMETKQWIIKLKTKVHWNGCLWLRVQVAAIISWVFLSKILPISPYFSSLSFFFLSDLILLFPPGTHSLTRFRPTSASLTAVAASPARGPTPCRGDPGPAPSAPCPPAGWVGAPPHQGTYTTRCIIPLTIERMAFSSPNPLSILPCT